MSLPSGSFLRLVVISCNDSPPTDAVFIWIDVVEKGVGAIGGRCMDRLGESNETKQSTAVNKTMITYSEHRYFIGTTPRIGPYYVKDNE